MVNSRSLTSIINEYFSLEQNALYKFQLLTSGLSR